jgi:ketosteroid isomerase-like protein
MRLIGTTLAATALCIGLALAAPAAAQDKATIQKHNDAFAAAFNKGDYATVAGMYAEDATLLPPGAEMVKGRAGIQAFWTKAGEGVTDAKLTAVEVTPLGGAWAREIGTFSLKTKASPPQELTGKYVVIWQKAGDDWKLATDIWNANK